VVAPNRKSGQTSQGNFNATGGTMTAASSTTSGNLGLVFVTTDNSTTISLSGYTQVAILNNSTHCTAAVFKRELTGSDDGTFTISPSVRGSWIFVEYEGSPDIANVEATTGTGAGSNADPPSHTPSGGSDDYLYEAFAGIDRSAAASAAPSGYSGFLSENPGSGASATTNIAYKSTTSSTSENPGTFTSSSEDYVVMTVSIPPASAGTSVTVNPSTLSATSSVQAPTLDLISNATVTPSVLSATTSVQAPTVSAEIHETATPSVLSATSSVETPTVSLASNATVTPSVLTVTSGVQTPTVTAIQNATATPTVLNSETVLNAPTVSAEVSTTVTPSTLSATSSVEAPTVSTGLNDEVTPSVLTATASVNEPSFDIVQSATATPSVLSASASVVQPLVGSQVPVEQVGGGLSDPTPESRAEFERRLGILSQGYKEDDSRIKETLKAKPAPKKPKPTKVKFEKIRSKDEVLRTAEGLSEKINELLLLSEPVPLVIEQEEPLDISFSRPNWDSQYRSVQLPAPAKDSTVSDTDLVRAIRKYKKLKASGQAQPVEHIEINGETFSFVAEQF